MGNELCKGTGCKGIEGELKCVENEGLNNFVNYQDYVKMEEIEDGVLGKVQRVKSLLDSREYLVKVVEGSAEDMQSLTVYLDCLLKAQQTCGELSKVLGYKASTQHQGVCKGGNTTHLQVILQQHQTTLLNILTTTHHSYNEGFYMHLYSQVLASVVALKHQNITPIDIHQDNLVIHQPNPHQPWQLKLLPGLADDHQPYRYYYSPAKLAYIQQLQGKRVTNSKYSVEYNEEHNLMWQLGLLFLELVLLQSQHDLYDWHNCTLDTQQLTNRLQALKMHNLSTFLTSLLSSSPPQSLETALRILHDYQKDQKHCINNTNNNTNKKSINNNNTIITHQDFTSVDRLSNSIHQQSYIKLGGDIDNYINHYDQNKNTQHNHTLLDNTQLYESQFYSHANQDIFNILQHKDTANRTYQPNTHNHYNSNTNNQNSHNDINNQNGQNNTNNKNGHLYIMCYKDGGRYEGDMEDGKRQGQGVLYFQNGNYYQGQWQQDQMHGQGNLYAQDATLVYQGQWAYQLFHGKGRLINEKYANNKNNLNNIKVNFHNLEQSQEYWVEYEGEFKKHMKDGVGKMLFIDGSSYLGEWKDDQIEGEGKFTFPSGQLIQGKWVNNQFITQDQKEFHPDNFKQTNQAFLQQSREQEEYQFSPLKQPPQQQQSQQLQSSQQQLQQQYSQQQLQQQSPLIKEYQYQSPSKQQQASPFIQEQQPAQQSFQKFDSNNQSNNSLQFNSNVQRQHSKDYENNMKKQTINASQDKNQIAEIINLN